MDREILVSYSTQEDGDTDKIVSQVVFFLIRLRGMLFFQVKKSLREARQFSSSELKGRLTFLLECLNDNAE